MARLGLWLDLFERARIFDIRSRQREMRQQRELADSFEMPDAEFIGTYSLSKPLVEDLILELQPLMRPTRREGDITIDTKICDASMYILSVDASHPGSCHDAFIWNAHPVNRHLQDIVENNHETTWLLGDSGYPQRKWLMPPILNAIRGSPEDNYTCLHVQARNVVERCFGVLKSRWQCLLSHRVLHYNPHMVGLIINACVILHNIAIRAGLPLQDLTDTDQEAEEAVRVPVDVDAQPIAGGRVAPVLAAG